MPRLRFGGHIFRFGLLIVVAWIALKALGIFSADVLTITAWTGFGIALVGILVTATHPSSIRVEVVSDT